jgi:hypothetical protein
MTFPRKRRKPTLADYLKRKTPAQKRNPKRQDAGPSGTSGTAAPQGDFR